MDDRIANIGLDPLQIHQRAEPDKILICGALMSVAVRHVAAKGRAVQIEKTVFVFPQSMVIIASALRNRYPQPQLRDVRQLYPISDVLTDQHCQIAPCIHRAASAP